MDDVEPPLPPLALADEGLCLPEPGGQIDRGQAAALAGGAQFTKENRVFARCNALVHVG